jgi:phage shock protein A
MSIQRAQDQIDQMQARAGAMDELISSGALTDLTHPVDDIEAQLTQISVTASVDTELAALRAQLPAPQAPELANPEGSTLTNQATPSQSDVTPPPATPVPPPPAPNQGEQP